MKLVICVVLVVVVVVMVLCLFGLFVCLWKNLTSAQRPLCSISDALLLLFKKPHCYS